MSLITHRTSAIGLSNDGDGDRFGVINEKAEYVTPNEIIALLLGHLIKNKGFSGKLVKTVGASRMLDIIAKQYDIDIVETPVGFKWVGAAMREYDTIIGGEESGGLSIKGHIPEKDGIIADLACARDACLRRQATVGASRRAQTKSRLRFYQRKNRCKTSRPAAA